jgi:hypothetical protein
MRVVTSFLHMVTRGRCSDERGIAMVSVVGMSAILFGFATIVMTRSISDYNQVRHDRRFEQAIQVADSGVDHMLFKLGTDLTYTTGETVPDFGGDVAAEEAWVLENVDDAEPDCNTTGCNQLVTTPEGQWATIRPVNAEVIYSVGYVPTRANPFRTRVIRAAYDYAPFVPSVAILTDGDLVISGNPSISGAGGSVHANGDIEFNGNPTVEGYASAVGECDGCVPPTVGDAANSGGGMPEREVPLIDPRENYFMSEYDLCPDATVRTGPSYSAGGGFFPNSTLTPCNGQILEDTGGGDEYRGWKMSGTDVGNQGAKWDMSGNTGYDGVYYVYQGSAKVSGTPGSSATPWNLTILAEAVGTGEEPTHCPHVGGDIGISGNPVMRRHDKAQPLHLIAGRDLEVSGNPGVSYEGVLAAHEQFSISGNPSITGAIIANDYCDTSGSPVSEPEIEVSGNPNIFYDGTLEIPLGRRIRTTHWNEL